MWVGHRSVVYDQWSRADVSVSALSAHAAAGAALPSASLIILPRLHVLNHVTFRNWAFDSCTIGPMVTRRCYYLPAEEFALPA